jgi:hypothetical protein
MINVEIRMACGDGLVDRCNSENPTRPIGEHLTRNQHTSNLAFRVLSGYSAIVLLFSTVLFAQAPEMEWATGYGTDYGNHVHHGMQTLDGGYIAVGDSWDETGYSNMLIVKTDAQGQLMWQRFIGEQHQSDMANSVCQDQWGDFYVGGGLVSGGKQESALVKLSQSGELIWQKIYPHDGADVIEGISLTSDGGLVATGYYESHDYGPRFIVMDGKGLLMKIDSAGNVQWDKTLASLPQGMMAYEVGDGYAIAGTVWKYKRRRRDHQDVCLVITDHEGNERWSGTYATILHSLPMGDTFLPGIRAPTELPTGISIC